MPMDVIQLGVHFNPTNIDNGTIYDLAYKVRWEEGEELRDGRRAGVTALLFLAEIQLACLPLLALPIPPCSSPLLLTFRIDCLTLEIIR